jgi:c-di-GMP-binding flagellar brake protein YcgR
MNHEMSTDDKINVSIPELRLRPGTEMKILDSKGRILSHKAQFVAVFAGKSILISLLVDNTKKIELRAGENYLVRGFTGKYDFSFNSSVLHIDSAQFNARFSCPESVAVKFVRSHLRAAISLEASVSAENKDNATSIIVKDLSAGGAGLDSAQPLGSIGEKIQLTLPVEFEKKKVNLSLTSIIRHITEMGTKIRTGVEFENASQSDKLMLHYYVHTLSEIGELN